MAKKQATAAKKPITKSELLNAISTETDLNRRQVGSVLDALNAQNIHADVMALLGH